MTRTPTHGGLSGPHDLDPVRTIDDAGGGDLPPPPPTEPPAEGGPGSPQNPFVVALTRSDDPTPEGYEIALWDVIEATSKAMSFSVYSDFLDAFFNHPTMEDREDLYWEKKRNSAIRRPVSSYGLDAWDLVTSATDIFVRHQAGALSDVNMTALGRNQGVALTTAPFADTGKAAFEDALVRQIGRNPNLSSYLELIRRKLAELPTIDTFSLSTNRMGIARDRIESPLLVELIWSYYMEQGMLVQTINAVLLRFQNVSSPDLVNSLRSFATDSLRSAGNLLWGCLQSQGSRLPLARRAQEYLNAYGLPLSGKAVPVMNVVESRSRFMDAFHDLLSATLAFYKEHDNLTVKADGFPLLNKLTEVHLLLAEGLINQSVDLSWTARSEMMSLQWLLARPEFREFLGGRLSVPYPEPWMDRVDTMKSLQNWSDISITSFYWLATYAEQILLSIRFGNWSMIRDGALAAKWAERWRYPIQNYAHHLEQLTKGNFSVPFQAIETPARRLARSAEAPRRIAANGASADAKQSAPALPPPDTSFAGRRRPAVPSPRPT